MSENDICVGRVYLLVQLLFDESYALLVILSEERLALVSIFVYESFRFPPRGRTVTIVLPVFR